MRINDNHISQPYAAGGALLKIKEPSLVHSTTLKVLWYAVLCTWPLESTLLPLIRLTLTSTYLGFMDSHLCIMESMLPYRIIYFDSAICRMKSRNY